MCPGSPLTGVARTTTWSHLGSTFSWLVTTIRVRSFSSCAIHCSNTFEATPGSSALKGSSRITMLLLEYAARARLTRAFCPPERLMPCSPTTVWSPSSSSSKSCASWHAWSTF
mmetsp:Transcript_9368/g.17261  ORF Transcript_9368/g.17261 Transcript_9368/m.17261 type:complete len:113 (+) Transcript_9368:2172-2510(+)